MKNLCLLTNNYLITGLNLEKILQELNCEFRNNFNNTVKNIVPLIPVVENYHDY